MRKKLCVNCFSEKTGKVCRVCGYSKALFGDDPAVLPRGTALRGKYIVGGVIGRGGFGTTYLAYDRKNEKILAVKEYFPQQFAFRQPDRSICALEGKEQLFESGRESFFGESERTAQFNGNPNIINVFESFYENNTAYFAQEYLGGVTLEDYISKYGLLSPSQAVFAADRLASALSAVHSAGLVHRDVSPDNIMICENGAVKLLDFGAARKISGEATVTVTMKTGFTAAEQYTQSKSCGAGADIYSLGAVMFFALTGKIPASSFERMENDEDFQKGLEEIPEKLARIVSKAARIVPSDRYLSADELRTALSASGIKPEPLAADDDILCRVRRFSAPPAKKRTTELPTAVGIGAATAAAAATVLAFAAVARTAGADIPENPVFSENIAREEQTLFLEFGDKYKGNMELCGEISAQTLKSFGADVKITLDVETTAPSTNISECFVIFPVNGDFESVTGYLSCENGGKADGNGGIYIEKNTSEVEFVLSREGIDVVEANGGVFGFQTHNVVIRSARLEKGSAGEKFSRKDEPLDKSAFTECERVVRDGKTVVRAGNFKYSPSVGGEDTDLIGKEFFDGFSGDVKVTCRFEHEGGEEWQEFRVFTYGLWGFHFEENITVSCQLDDSGRSLVNRTESFAVSPDISLSECSFIIPKRLVGKIEEGVWFRCANMRIIEVTAQDAD